MKGLTVQQPYANMILFIGKDIENRTKYIKIRGTIALHAGKQLASDEYLPKAFKKQIVRGAIFGVVDIIDCVDDHESEWFNGPYGYVLANPRPLPIHIPNIGQLGLWNVPPGIERRINRQLAGKIRIA